MNFPFTFTLIPTLGNSFLRYRSNDKYADHSKGRERRSSSVRASRLHLRVVTRRSELGGHEQRDMNGEEDMLRLTALAATTTTDLEESLLPTLQVTRHQRGTATDDQLENTPHPVGMNARRASC